jgi:alpha/beta superfamily hydrolase
LTTPPYIPKADIFEERIVIAAHGRTIEGTLAYRLAPEPTWACLLAGPHPLLGGEMGNNVVRALVARAAEAGAVVLSFNYAGVGESEGGPTDWPAAVSTFWREASVPEELQWREDASAALHDLVNVCGARPCVAIGYSFGCWAIAEAATLHPVRALVLISPNPARHDFAALDQIDTPVLVLHSDNEIECSPEQLAQWYQVLREPKRLCRIAAAEHFFRNHENEVANAVVEFLVARAIPLDGDAGP